MDPASLAKAMDLFGDNEGHAPLGRAGMSIKRTWLSESNGRGGRNANYGTLPDGEVITHSKLRWSVAVIKAWAVAIKTGIKPHVPSIDLYRKRTIADFDLADYMPPSDDSERE